MATADRRQALLAAFERLDPRQQDMLMDFAATLAASGGAPEVPQPEPRPDHESVVMAIRRLTRTCAQADRRRLMGPASLLMAQHALQGRAAAEVIAELEVLFGQFHAASATNRK